MKKSYFFALAALVLTGCANDSFNGLKGPEAGEPGAIAFGSGTHKLSRADNLTGKNAADALGNTFVVEGYKTMADNSKQQVFDDYTVKYTEDSELTTESNTKGWEYVGVNDAKEQTIKFWDHKADHYTFAAYSLGVQATGSTAAASAIDYTKIGSTNEAFHITGTVKELQKCYVSNVEIVEPANYATAVSPETAAATAAVNMKFKKMQSQVRIGFYEVIPGYSVKNIRFYDAAGNKVAGNEATLYSANKQFSDPDAAAKMVVTYPKITNKTETGYLQPVVTFSQTDATAKVEDLKLGKRIAADDETTIATNNNPATLTDWLPVVPMEAGALTIKVDYTLVSDDHSEEKIEIEGATATIPATFTTWQPNFTYTYIFKITEETTELYPITFDATVIADEEGNQETITVVEDPSITTYQKGTQGKDEYVAGIDIYAVFQNASPIDAEHVFLYTLVNADNTAAVTTEANCINAYGKPDKTYAGFKLADADNGTFSATTAIPMEDGTTKTAPALKITNPAAGTNYVVIFDNKDDAAHKIVAKVIKVEPTAEP